MGLDVMVCKIFTPTTKNLRSKRSRRDFERRHHCSICTIENPKSIKKLKEAGFLLEWDDPDIIDWKATFAARGLNNEDWSWVYQEGCEFGFCRVGDEDNVPKYEFGKSCENFQVFKGKEIKTALTHVTGICIGDKDLGYQRKGANGQFYEDGKWTDDTIVTTKEELLEDWDKYFGHSDEFKRNIVDNFVEGETVVLYW